MTAEIIVMNKQAISLAADSAVTIGDIGNQKIFTSANKIFMLSRFRPVGIMIYDSAEFMGVPWETVIKVYRKKLGKNSFKQLREYVDDFLRFIQEDGGVPPKERERYILSHISGLIEMHKRGVVSKYNKIVNEKGPLNEDEVKKMAPTIITSSLSEFEQAINAAPTVARVTDKEITELLNTQKEKIKEIITSSVELLHFDVEQEQKFIELAVKYFVKELFWFKEGNSGIVIAGFGEDETYPSAIGLYIEGKIGSNLKYREAGSIKIDADLPGMIIPLAQQDMAKSFMEGIEPKYREEINQLFFRMLHEYPKTIIDTINELDVPQKEKYKTKYEEIAKEKFKEYNEKMGQFAREKYIDPVMRVVYTAPKEELAAMAETLVNLTSFKRKVSWQAETVGGPIDVAVISKGDGFIWIKRKHYFKAELNPHFVPNQSLDIENGGITDGNKH